MSIYSIFQQALINLFHHGCLLECTLLKLLWGRSRISRKTKYPYTLRKFKNAKSSGHNNLVFGSMGFIIEAIIKIGLMVWCLTIARDDSDGPLLTNSITEALNAADSVNIGDEALDLIFNEDLETEWQLFWMFYR